MLEHHIKLSKKNEIKRLKCGSLPAKADPVAQRMFYEKTLHPLMQKAKKGKIALLFVDASHFIMGCDYLGYIYGKVRRFIRTYSGRSRYNVLGALDYASKKLTTITNDAYITAAEVCELIKKVSEEYAGKPIFMVLDNARYQKCLVVQALALELNVNLIYIPPYSPNLNLIERLWKHTKTKLRTKYYDDFSVFKETIDSITDSTNKNDKTVIDKLIGDKVQLFDSKVFDNVVDIPSIKKSIKQQKKVA
jgi:transposase